MKRRNHRVVEFCFGEKQQLSKYASIETLIYLISTNKKYDRLDSYYNWHISTSTPMAYTSSEDVVCLFYHNFPTAAKQYKFSPERQALIFAPMV